MKKHTWSQFKWLALVLVTGLGSCGVAIDPLAVYQISWDGGGGNWHTVPKLIQGISTIYFTNNRIACDVHTGADGIQVLQTQIEDPEPGDFLAFTEVSNSARRYVIRGEARWENADGPFALALGVSNSNYAGTVGVSTNIDGNDKWEGTHDWQPFTIKCDIPPAVPPPTATSPNRFIAEMGYHEKSRGMLELRNLRLEVYGDDSVPAPDIWHLSKRFIFGSFGTGVVAGIIGCLLYLRFQKITHERELRRIASLDSPQN